MRNLSCAKFVCCERSVIINPFQSEIMHAPTSQNTISRRSDKSSWTALWLAMVCALLLVSPGQAAPSLSQMRQVTASYETVFHWLQNAEAAPDSRAQVLQTLCQSAGLDYADTARVLESYQQWTREHSTPHHAAIATASTCSVFAPLILRDVRPFAARASQHTGRAAHSLAVCYLE